MHAGRMRNREKEKAAAECDQRGESKIRENEGQRLKEIKYIQCGRCIFKKKSKGKATAPPGYWPSSPTACSRDISFVGYLSGKWLVVIQSDCLSLGRVSERTNMWKRIQTSLTPAASINLYHQIKHTEINPHQLGNMQIALVYVNGSGGGNSAMWSCPKWQSRHRCLHWLLSHGIKCSCCARTKEGLSGEGVI